MIDVDNILVSEDIVDARFACNLSACLGACCVHGDSGAPLEDDECEWLDSIVPEVSRYLSRKSKKVLKQHGPWERSRAGNFVTTCVDDAECVFVTYERGVAKCSIQKAHQAGRVDRPKPISCHLFPIRVSRKKGRDVLQYERIDLC